MTLSKREQIIMKISKVMVEAYLRGERNEAEIMTTVCNEEGLSPDETVSLVDDITKFAVKENQV